MDYYGVQLGRPEYGKSMMLAPGDSTYVLELKWSQRKHIDVNDGGDVITSTTEELVDWDSKYTIKVPKSVYNAVPGTNPQEYAFQPGVYYQVKIMVYGLQKIIVTASIASWREEENPIVINPDDDEVTH